MLALVALTAPVLPSAPDGAEAPPPVANECRPSFLPPPPFIFENCFSVCCCFLDITVEMLGLPDCEGCAFEVGVFSWCPPGLAHYVSQIFLESCDGPGIAVGIQCPGMPQMLGDLTLLCGRCI